MTTEKQLTSTKKSITTTESGQFDFTDLNNQLATAKKLLDLKIISDTFKNPEQVVIAIQFCLSLGFDPLTGLKMMYVVHGKPVLFGDGPLSLIQSSGKLEWIKEFWTDKNGEVISFENKNLNEIPTAAVCQLKRVGDEHIQEDYFTLKDLSLAQIKSPVWGKYERTMMRYRARGQALKAKFADILNGVDIAEYISPDLPKENMRIESPVIEMAGEELISGIQSMLNALEITLEDLPESFRVSDLQNLTNEKAKSIVNLLTLKLAQGEDS